MLESASGSVTPPDLDGDGSYDINVDCLWTVQAPEDYVIRYVIQFFEIEYHAGCGSDILMVSNVKGIEV